MRATLEERCQRFIVNRDIIKIAFPMESAYIYPVCAAIFTQKNITADGAKLKECHALLKEKTSVFSNFRGYARLAMIAMMATDYDPEKKLERAKTVYDKLKEHFMGSQYLPLASMVISDSVESEKYSEICSRTRKIYDLLKSEHPMLTSSEDVVFSAILAMSDLYEKQIVDDTERCYKILKETFYSSNAVQSLSHVLALFEGSARQKCREATDLFDQLKEKGCRYGTQYELATLGVLAMQKRENENIIEDLLETDAYLATCKGYRGIFGFPKKTRLMHASMIVFGGLSDDQTVMNTAAIGGTVAMVIAQQAAMCAAIAAAVAASSSNN